MSTTKLEQCASFEWRGPFQSLSRVSNDSVAVIRDKTDWSDVVGEKPLIDHRNANLADLYPKPRSVFERGLKAFENHQQPQNSTPKFRGPSN